MARRRKYMTNAARQAAYRKRKKQPSHGNSSEWEVPLELFRWLDKEFRFTLDVCASPQNTKCEDFYTDKDDALKQEWTGACWCNPPCRDYDEIAHWVRKAYESSKSGATVVCLVPAETDREWFHDWVLAKAELRFLRHELWFSNGRGRQGAFANRPSVVLIYRPATKKITG